MQTKDLTQFLGFEVDSRKIRPGWVFFALKGKKANGEDFLKEAAKKGAKVAVVSRKYKGDSFGLFLIRVNNVFKTLQALAKKRLKQKRAEIIGITGSVGKTTVKEFLAVLLETEGKIDKTQDNQNSQIGLPLSILNMRIEMPKFIVLEMGVSLKGEMQKLAWIAEPDVGVIANVGLVHSENFQDEKEILLEKLGIFRKKTKIKIVNFELVKKYSESFSGIGDFFTFSIKNPKADFFLKKEKEQVLVFEKGKKVAVLENFLKEMHLLEDFLIAFATARKLQVAVEKIVWQAAKLKHKKIELRFEKILKNGICFIQDCYNSNELSVSAALENLPQTKGKKIAVLGDMKELGRFSRKCHQNIGSKAFQTVDLLLGIGKEAETAVKTFLRLKQKKRSSQKKAFWFEDKTALAKFLKKQMQKDDVVLIKGSRSLQMEKLLDGLF